MACDLNQLRPGVLRAQAIRRGQLMRAAKRDAARFWARPARRPSRFWATVAWGVLWALLLALLGPLVGCVDHAPRERPQGGPGTFSTTMAARGLNPCRCNPTAVQFRAADLGQ